MNTEAETGLETAPESDDVRADVAAAYAAHSEPEKAQEEPTETQETAAAGDEDEAAKAARIRDERGRFTKAEQEAQDAAAATVSDADPAKDQPAQQSNAVEPPTSWSADAKAEWQKLPPALQQAVSKREAEMSAGQQRWSEEKRGFEETLAPLRQVAQSLGIDERTGLNRLLSADQYLRRDPANAIAWLAKTYGVDLSNLTSDPQPQQRVDPALAQLHQEVSTLKHTLEQQKAAETEASINAFKEGKEHFDTVRVAMGRLMMAEQATTMQEAYDMACWANPDIRAKLIAGQTAAEAAARQAREREATDKARRGAISVTGAPAGAAPAPKQDYETVEEATRAAFRQHAG